MVAHRINHISKMVLPTVKSGPPSRVFTPSVLKRTYNADVVVTDYMGMKLVAESPHFFGRNGKSHAHESRSSPDPGSDVHAPSV